MNQLFRRREIGKSSNNKKRELEQKSWVSCYQTIPLVRWLESRVSNLQLD